MIELHTNPDLFLPEIGIHLDSLRARPFGFISHGHADHFGSHQRILCSQVTASILKARYRVRKQQLTTLAFHQPFIERGFIYELLPAGHITGSAMLHITRQSDGATLLYTGDCKTRVSHTAETIAIKPADCLIIESTFANPLYHFPPLEQVTAQLIDFIEQCFKDNTTPILVAYALGKAQEAHAILTQHDICPVLHHATAKIALACIKAGIPLGEYSTLDELVPERHCLIVPPGYLKHTDMASILKKRTAMLTGWAMDPTIALRRKEIDHFIPLSDHADYQGLLDIIQQVAPKNIVTVHGSTTEFAADLRQQGYNAQSIEALQQATLTKK